MGERSMVGCFWLLATQCCLCIYSHVLHNTVLGNSVPRQFAFGMVDMLGGGFVKREGQRDMCPKHETFWGDSCHNTFANVSFRFSHLQFMDGFNYSGQFNGHHFVIGVNFIFVS